MQNSNQSGNNGALCNELSAINAAEPVQNKLVSIPFDHLIHNPKKDLKRTLELCKSVYDAVYFCGNLSASVKNLIEQKSQGKSFLLKGSNNKNRQLKTLYLDLDETLIHSSLTTPDGFDQQIEIEGKIVWFNVRPYTFEFLKNMAQIFQLVLFTASEKKYAEAFFDYLNMMSESSISSLLSRSQCIHFYKGLYFKDLRTIINRNLKDVVLLDNSTYCFGCQLNNGIPIASFTNDPSDLELLYMENYLKRLSLAEDVREFNAKELRLAEILNVKKAQS